MKKKFMIVLLVAIVVSLFTEFTLKYSSANKDIDEKAVVHAIGIDFDEEKKEYEVTLQILSPTGSGGTTAIDVSGSNNEVISKSSKTIENAIDKCESVLGKETFLGHTELILIGNKVKNIKTCEEFIINNQQIYLGTILGCAEKTAKEILSVQINYGAYTAETLKNMFEESRQNGDCTDYEIIKILNRSENTNGDCIIPILSKTEEKKNSDSSSQSGGSQGGSGSSQEQNVNSLNINSGMVFKDYKAYEKIDLDTILGISLINNTMKSYSVPVKINDKLYSIDIECKRVNTDISKSGESIDISKTLSIYIDMPTIVNRDDHDKVKEKVEKHLIDVCQKASDTLIKDIKIDAFNIDSTLNHYDLTLYDKYKESTQDFLSKVNMNIKIKVKN